MNFDDSWLCVEPLTVRPVAGAGRRPTCAAAAGGAAPARRRAENLLDLAPLPLPPTTRAYVPPAPRLQRRTCWTWRPSPCRPPPAPTCRPRRACRGYVRLANTYRAENLLDLAPLPCRPPPAPTCRPRRACRGYVRLANTYRAENLLDLAPLPLPPTTRAYVPPAPRLQRNLLDLAPLPLPPTTRAYVPPAPRLQRRTCWTWRPSPCRPPPAPTCRPRRACRGYVRLANTYRAENLLDLAPLPLPPTTRAYVPPAPRLQRRTCWTWRPSPCRPPPAPTCRPRRACRGYVRLANTYRAENLLDLAPLPLPPTTRAYVPPAPRLQRRTCWTWRPSPCRPPPAPTCRPRRACRGYVRLANTYRAENLLDLAPLPLPPTTRAYVPPAPRLQRRTCWTWRPSPCRPPPAPTCRPRRACRGYVRLANTYRAENLLDLAPLPLPPTTRAYVPPAPRLQRRTCWTWRPSPCRPPPAPTCRPRRACRGYVRLANTYRAENLLDLAPLPLPPTTRAYVPPAPRLQRRTCWTWRPSPCRRPPAPTCRPRRACRGYVRLANTYRAENLLDLAPLPLPPTTRAYVPPAPRLQRVCPPC
ncbi:uncharacterized protein LOC133525309 [Cydia pomonella]|uniref:uncharacterized protein LOC133525309 n=1 Tax=Cydia pomonella TaxID=82600 RepID=UPI002ADD4250|nr:uncharacterized protein LOC133525309 [Cydia pomonella]